LGKKLLNSDEMASTDYGVDGVLKELFERLNEGEGK
jgi:hypothetical protein